MRRWTALLLSVLSAAYWLMNFDTNQPVAGPFPTYYACMDYRDGLRRVDPNTDHYQCIPR